MLLNLSKRSMELVLFQAMNAYYDGCVYAHATLF